MEYTLYKSTILLNLRETVSTVQGFEGKSSISVRQLLIIPAYLTRKR